MLLACCASGAISFAPHAVAAPAPPAQGTLNVARREFLPSFRAEVKRNPDSAARLLRKFWDEHPDDTDQLLIIVSIEAASILSRVDRTRPERTLELLAATEKRFAASPFRFLATQDRAQLLRREGRTNEAALLLEAAWPQVKTPTLNPMMLAILSERVEVLRAQKKPEAAVALLEEALTSTPPLANLMNFYRLLVPALQEAGRNDDALRWAGLYFRICPFESDDIARSTALLTRLWLEAGAQGVEKTARFATAQTDIAAPNPLDKLALPRLTAPVEAALRERVAQGESASSARVAIYLALGDARAAMLEARELLLLAKIDAKTGENVGAREVARVFKAADGDVARANAFLEWTRSGVGENPILPFLRASDEKNKAAFREVTP